MKQISMAMQEHLAQTVTTLATCWKITRTDGVFSGYTSLDVDLIIDGVTYRAAAGFSRTAINTGSTGGIDNLEVTGFFEDNGVTEADMKARRFDYAEVLLFVVNWTDLSMGPVKMRRGWLGECQRMPNGGFMAELRGINQALVQEVGTSIFSPLCRADLGDNQCKVPIKPPGWQPSRLYTKGDYVQAVPQDTDTARVSIFLALNTGINGSTQPDWPLLGSTVVDGEVTWQSMPPLRQIGSVVTPLGQQTFVASPLGLPPNLGDTPDIGMIAIVNNVSAGTHVQITDGIHVATWNNPFDIRGSGGNSNDNALYAIQAVIAAAGLDMTVSISKVTLTLTNHSGQTASITKTGDSLGSIVIQQFGTPPLDGGTLTWITGSNHGLSMEMKTYDSTSGVVQLWLEMPYPIQAEDRFFYYPGCDKRRDTCHTRFNNILNNRSEPDMPGMDSVLSYPSV